MVGFTAKKGVSVCASTVLPDIIQTGKSMAVRPDEPHRVLHTYTNSKAGGNNPEESSAIDT
jgi:hypothetical protein